MAGAAIEIKDFGYQLHKTEGNDIAIFELTKSERSSTVDYAMYVSTDGRWMAKRITKTSADGKVTDEIKFSYGPTGWQAAYAMKESLDYYYINELIENVT